MTCTSADQLVHLTCVPLAALQSPEQHMSAVAESLMRRAFTRPLMFTSAMSDMLMEQCLRDFVRIQTVSTGLSGGWGGLGAGAVKVVPAAGIPLATERLACLWPCWAVRH
jgi:hypothetical protein